MQSSARHFLCCERVMVHYCTVHVVLYKLIHKHCCTAVTQWYSRYRSWQPCSDSTTRRYKHNGTSRIIPFEESTSVVEFSLKSWQLAFITATRHFTQDGKSSTGVRTSLVHLKHRRRARGRRKIIRYPGRLTFRPFVKDKR